jgi:tetratricopeptide (TPR) repeat protein
MDESDTHNPSRFYQLIQKIAELLKNESTTAIWQRGVVVRPKSSKSQVKSLQATAHSLYRDGEFSQALATCYRAIDRADTPDSLAHLYLNAGAAAWAVGRFEECLTLSHMAIANANEIVGSVVGAIVSVTARANLAVALVELSRPEEALAETDPKNETQWPTPSYLLPVTRARVLIHLNQLDSADSIFRELQPVVQSMKPQVARRYYIYHAKMLVATNRTQAAIDELEHVLNIYGPSPLCLFLLVDAYSRIGNQELVTDRLNWMQRDYPDAFHTIRATEAHGTASNPTRS